MNKNVPVNPAHYGLPGLPRQPAGPVLGVAQRGFSAFGLNTPFERTVAVTVVVGAALNAVQPKELFDAHGAIPFSLFSSESEESTHLPWWLISIGCGVIAGQMF